MFTVDNFLNAGLMPWFKVLAGEGQLKEKAIEHVSVIELPVGDFVRKNELVISTALGCYENEASMLELITDVHSAQACALLLTNPTDSVELYQSCMEYIQNQQFPVIVIPWECRFADLLESVLDRIRDHTVSEIAFYDEIPKKLLSTYLSNSDFNSAAQIVAESFCSECIISDVNNHIKGAYRHVLQQGNAFSERMDQSSAIEIKTRERLYGYLYLSCSENINEALIHQYLTAPLILWFDKERVIQTAKQGEKDDFVWRLAKDSLSAGTREEMIKKGQLLGFNLLYQYTCVVGKIRLDASTPLDDTAKWIASNINPIKEEIIALADSMRKQIMLTYQQGLLIMYIENPSSGLEQHANRFLDKLEKKFASIFPHLLFSWGISEISNEPTDFHEYYLHAKLAQELCPQTISKNIRYSYENTIIFNMLSVLAADPKIKKDSLSIIQPIIEHDQVNQTKLLHTLKIYLQTKNVSETARILHLHRQSLLYRVNKIEELVGMSLKDSDNAFLLEICVRLFMRD